ncbi:MAG: hypothetical protein SGJ10_06900 [Bacteroidota bacterium]|nr:hypothetical protein [Bacteroidota bacterium]
MNKFNRLGALVIIVFVFLLMPLLWGGCKKDKVLANNFSLNFSEDTLIFDTVFTKMGNGNPPSMYQYLVVYNNEDRTITTRVRLGGAGTSPFRMNVDGRSGPVVDNVVIRAKDSLFIFVEAFPDQNNQNNPLVITDSILFDNTNDLKNVKLVCWGQDAHYLYDSVLTGNIKWADNLKPYVIYNSVLIDPASTLTIGRGVHVYSHNNSKIYVQGTLKVQGDTDAKVVFEGDRLQYSYRNESNQWRGIRFMVGSNGNQIKNAIIKNATIGIEIDSIPIVGKYNVVLEGVEIRNHSIAGIYCFMGSVQATNCLVANCGQYTLAGLAGGRYDFYNCTFACYSNMFSRKNEQFGISNKEVLAGAISYKAPLSFDIQNCVIYGDQDDEAVFVLETPAISAAIDNCLIKAKDAALINFISTGNKNILAKDPEFVDYITYNFRIGKTSPCIEAGNNNNPITYDITGKYRINLPDIGCYEY